MTIRERINTSDLGIGIVYGVADETKVNAARDALSRLLALVEAAENSAVIASGSSSSFGSPAIEMLLKPALSALREHGDI